jgi:alpha-L-arabinofuranosidase
MDKYDQEKRMALCVDEWGVWTDAEPGTNPDFLYQQNSLRDALVAASTLNIFNNHSARVRVANLAQCVNVIQSLILTKGDSMVLIPTYHVFDLYKVRQDARLLPVHFTSPQYKYTSSAESIPALNITASKDSLGTIHLSLVNFDPNEPITLTTQVNAAVVVSGQILTSEKIADINTFSHPNNITIQPFTGFAKMSDGLTITLPSKSIVVLSLK